MGILGPRNRLEKDLEVEWERGSRVSGWQLNFPVQRLRGQRCPAANRVGHPATDS